MVKVDMEGNILGFSILNLSSLSSTPTKYRLQ